ncbi:MAG: ABC transporter [Candidatus Hydrogenedentota bacterium]|nr:MAG: ABC transporter [Candidatus Hydrogenedentota bacterium]
MARIIVRRLLVAGPVLLAIVTLTFFLIRLAPGGPFDDEKAVSPEIKERIEAYYHLNAPLHEQYFKYLKGLVQGDMGPSFKNASYSVNELIALSFPVSLELGFYALCVALGIGLLAGVLASLAPNTLRDYIPMSIAMVGICVPNFVLGPLLVLFFGLQLGWLPVSGWDEPLDKILPSITLGAMYAAYIARLSRGGMLEVLSNDFIRTARAKGLSETRVILRHALRGGLTPVVSYLGPAAAGLISGSFVVETIYQIPGLGRFFVEAAFNRDYTMIMGTVLVYATLVLMLNMVVDVLHTWLDPRLRDA